MKLHIIPIARERWQIHAPILLTCAAAWAFLVFEPGSMALHSHSGSMHVQSGEKLTLPFTAALRMQLMHNPPAKLALGWAMMLAAMMAPMMILPLGHVRARSFAHRRLWAGILFTAGYIGFWMATGLVLLAFALSVKLIIVDSKLLIVAMAAIAVAWQFSPLKQRCLNRCHMHGPLAAFGLKADFDSLRFGLTHGIWCAGSCWALMLLPYFAPVGHMAAMAIITGLLWLEKIEDPAPLKWHCRIPVKARRIILARIRRLKFST